MIALLPTRCRWPPQDVHAHDAAGAEHSAAGTGAPGTCSGGTRPFAPGVAEGAAWGWGLGTFFLVIVVSFYIFYVDVFFWWFGLNQMFCFMGIRGWHEFWMVRRVGNGGCGMGATIVQPASSCEAWTVKIVKTQLRDVIVVRNFASLWFVPIPNSSACSISGSRVHHGCKSMKTGMEPWNLYFWAAGWVNLFTLAIKHGLLENHPICNRWFSYINTHLVEPVV